MNKLIIITGPTAVGKTKLAIEVAKRLNTEIISCDSRQIYKELTIGTAKPSNDELMEVPHHFINHISISEEYSVGHFQREATLKIKELFKTNKYIVVTGGTGLYIKSILYNLDDFPTVPEEIRQLYNDKFNTNGLESLQAELSKRDPEYYARIDKSNARRIIRALSVIEVSGKTYSSFLGQKNNKTPQFDYYYIVLNRDREELYNRINERVELMVQDGLINEVKSLMSYVSLKALQTVGYQELFPYFKQECTLDYSINKIKQHSRNYAKRQLTWFRKIDNAIHLNAKSTTADTILNIVKKDT